MLSGCNGVSLWAGDASESAIYLVEAALGGYSSWMVSDWSLLVGYDRVAVSPSSWITPMFVLMVVLSLIRLLAFPLLVLVSLLTMLPLFGMSVTGVRLILFTLWVMFSSVEVSVLFQGLFNLFEGLGRLLDGHPGSIPFELLKDGDLLLLIDRMLRLRGLNTVRMSKVKGHADEAMVLHGQVREVDRLGNNAADDAADFGRRRVGNAVIDARLLWSLVSCYS